MYYYYIYYCYNGYLFIITIYRLYSYYKIIKVTYSICKTATSIIYSKQTKPEKITEWIMCDYV